MKGILVCLSFRQLCVKQLQLTSLKPDTEACSHCSAKNFKSTVLTEVQLNGPHETPGDTADRGLLPGDGYPAVPHGRNDRYLRNTGLT